MNRNSFIIAAALCVLAAAPASAKQQDRGPTPGLGWGPGGSKGGPVALAGAGLPALLLVGMYALVRSRRGRI